MEVLLLIVMASANVFCLLLGAKVGQAVKNGEKVEMPSLDPLKAIREHESRKEAQKEQDRLDTILRNIEGYDGTNRGQEEVPGR